MHGLFNIPRAPQTLRAQPNRRYGFGLSLLLFLVSFPIVFALQGCVQPGSSSIGGIPSTKSGGSGGQAKKAFQVFDTTGTLPTYSKDKAKGHKQTAQEVFPGAPGDIVTIPARSVIHWRTKGNCMDPNLPAPRKGDKFRLIRSSSLIPPDVQPLYKNFMRLTRKDPEARRHQQQIVWCMRTISEKSSSYCDGLGKAQKDVLDRAQPGGHDVIVKARQRHKQKGQALGLLKKIAPQIKVNGQNISVVDLLDPNTGPQIVEEQLQQLIQMPLKDFAPDLGYEFTELEPGIYAEVVGDGPLSLDIRVANTTDEPYDFDPTIYAAHPQRKAQKVTLAPPGTVETKKSKDSKESRDSRDSRDSRESRDSRPLDRKPKTYPESGRSPSGQNPSTESIWDRP